MKRRKKRQNNGLFLHFAHWETLKISEANGKCDCAYWGMGILSLRSAVPFGGNTKL